MIMKKRLLAVILACLVISSILLTSSCSRSYSGSSANYGTTSVYSSDDNSYDSSSDNDEEYVYDEDSDIDSDEETDYSKKRTSDKTNNKNNNLAKKTKNSNKTAKTVTKTNESVTKTNNDYDNNDWHHKDYYNYGNSIEVDNNAESSKFETVLFGNIEWIVLDYDNSKALLLTKDITELRPYHNDVENVTWEKCTLRSYLNNTWFNNTFSESEKKRILTTYVNNNDNNEYGTPGGNDTKDKVFLLSIDEVKKYFSTDSERIAFYRGEAERWWLRSPGDYRDHAADITNHGHIHSNGQYVYESAENWGGWSVGVRPAILIDLNS